ncbi:hypothetical protein V5O48_010354 [Marasmius crinis-equi]|uniref:Uncharacterized protein n=1 Tax=Marasmius crinis-equi TaxID=585013 RepID=A0ABR3F971_9AGAR
MTQASESHVNINDAALSGSRISSKAVSYLIDILSRVLSLLRFPFSILLFLWIASSFSALVVSILVQPLCHLPGASHFAFCNPELAVKPWKPQWADFKRLNEAESTTFEQLLDIGVGGSSLSLEIKKAEMASADLLIALRLSDIGSRDSIVDSLSNFINDARVTARGLSKFSVKIIGAVEEITAVNDYTIRSIRAARARPMHSGVTSILAQWIRGDRSSHLIIRAFSEAMDVLSIHLRRLILEAEIQLSNLEKLEEGLSLLHALVARENISVSAAKSEVLSELWTKFGGNRQVLRSYNDNLTLLKDLSSYRKQALLQVVTSLQVLRTMNDEMEELRERVAAPAQAGNRIPVEIQLRSISTGLERLKLSKLKAKEKEEESIKIALENPLPFEIF